MSASDLYGADRDWTLGMDPDRYMRHQRGECPPEAKCAICILDRLHAEIAELRTTILSGGDLRERIAQAIDDAWRDAMKREPDTYREGYLDGMEHAEAIARSADLTAVRP